MFCIGVTYCGVDPIAPCVGKQHSKRAMRRCGPFHVEMYMKCKNQPNERFQYVCINKHALEPTDNDKVMWCGSCKQKVHLVNSRVELEWAKVKQVCAVLA